MKNRHTLLQIIALLVVSSFANAQWAITSDSWSVTDALGRKATEYSTNNEKRQDKFVAIFYHTWHVGRQVEYSYPVNNLTDILAANDEATIVQDWNNPAWGDVIDAPEGSQTYYWDQPLFGYYRITDEWVLRKHAEMLADAGVDVVFFDATNGSVTWKEGYTTLLNVWKQARIDGVKTPKIAFMLAFGYNIDGPLAAINELYTDLYKNPGEFEDLIFYWKGKPLIMAYPEILENVPPAEDAGMKFTATSNFTSVMAECPSWSNNIGDLTISLYKWDTDYNTSVSGTPIASKKYIDFIDNSRLSVDFSAQGAGDYVITLTDARETVGVYKFDQETDGVDSYFNGSPVSGDYMTYIKYEGEDLQRIASGTSWTPVPIQPGYDVGQIEEMKNHFTFRPGQPDYVNGSSSRPADSPNWGWLEVYPQHSFANNEQVTVGIAQNASSHSNGRCTAFNGPDTYGRNYSKLTNSWDTGENAMYKGANFSEQWTRALELNPELVFVTGWNEWTASRWKNWSGCTSYSPVEVGFADTFDGFRSRDIEPVKSWGKYGDAYYVQLVDNVRKFKGMDKQDTASAEKTVSVGDFNSWGDVKPEFLDYKGDTMHRNSPGAGSELTYTNATGRNDIVLAKVARDKDFVYFYVETNEDITPSTDDKWMRLFIDIDRDKATGWEGYDYVLNRVSPGDKALLEKSIDTWDWSTVDSVDYAVSGKMMEVKIPRSALGLSSEDEIAFEFKWSDNMQEEGNIMDFYVNGDSAPGGRFNFVYNTNNVTGIRRIGGVDEEDIKLTNYPNPFRNETTIEFSIPTSMDINIIIYDIVGNRIKTLKHGYSLAGVNTIKWNGCDDNGNKVNAGIYFCMVESNKGVKKGSSLVKVQ